MSYCFGGKEICVVLWGARVDVYLISGGQIWFVHILYFSIAINTHLREFIVILIINSNNRLTFSNAIVCCY